jgi:hypothetical protein
MRIKRLLTVFKTSLIALLLASCSQESKTLMLDNSQAYLTSPEKVDSLATTTPDDTQLFLNFAPLFVIENENLVYNKIGQPGIKRLERKKLQAYVDPSNPNIFVMKRDFTTGRGSYTNLIYRVHFLEVPFGILPFQLGTGKNVGLLLIMTLNDRKEPVLITTVHTCGCYVSIIPTNFLSKSAYPSEWKNEPVYRYGEKHPPILEYPIPFNASYHPVLYLRTATHRVADIFIERVDVVEKKFSLKKLQMRSMDKLDELPIDGETETASFFEDGLNKGFVRSDYKPFEFLFMSLIAMDPNIGVDKKYAPSSELRSRFYTSLNPLEREASDLWEFESFLEFWGWQL